jgi:hypothetical protein
MPLWWLFRKVGLSGHQPAEFRMGMHIEQTNLFATRVTGCPHNTQLDLLHLDALLIIPAIHSIIAW